MDLHSRARSCPASRALLVQRVRVEGWKAEQASKAAGISRRTAFKWLARHRVEGEAGLRDRSSRPHAMPRRMPDSWRDVILQLRRQRMTGLQIARRLRLPRSTVARVLHRNGLSRFRDLEPAKPVIRYEWKRPGDLLHLDIKPLVRILRVGHRIHGDQSKIVKGAGWEYVHVAIDDHSRWAHVEVLPRQDGLTTAQFLRRAVLAFRRHGVRVRRILSDNGGSYQSHAFRDRCTALGLEHRRTRPYRPQTNGKAERFIQTLLREWAYVRPYPTSKKRTAALLPWLHHYNHRRPHGSLLDMPPISRLKVRSEQRV